MICNLNDVSCMKKEMYVILAVFCLFSCKSGKQAERNLAVDSLAVNHRHSREERWDFDSLARNLRIVLDSVEVVCLADTTARMPRKGGVVMRVRRAEVVRGETLVESKAHSRQETDAVQESKKTEAVEREQRTPPVEYRQKSRRKTVLAMTVALLCFLWVSHKKSSDTNNGNKGKTS